MRKVVIVVWFSIGMLFAEISMPRMMDINLSSNISSLKEKIKVPDLLDMNVSSMIDKVDANVTSMVKKMKEIGVEWRKSLEEAFDIAKVKDRTIMVMVESEDCRWCKKMLERTISDDGIQNRLSEYVTVRVKREDIESMKKLPSVNGVPTIFFMDKDSKIIETVIGYFDVMDFNSYIGDVERKLGVKK